MTRRKKPINRPGAAAPASPAPTSQPPSKPLRRWYKADLHIHTLASHDYEEPTIRYLDILRTAVERGMDMIAITDHNTVAGVGAMRREIEWLTRLERDNRLNESERALLLEWRELSNKVLVLPGFEFTATFGFHILGIFAPETSVRQMEHCLLSLKVPEEKLDVGSTETGSSTDVINAYRIIREAGGLVIAAHANSTHGVAMRNFPFGGQTKIAYTQDAHLDALEVTDFDHRGHSTARFFNGSKAEYPRRMHCIQGSDAHRLTVDPKNPKRLGIGERATEISLEEPTYEALAALLRSSQFDRTRPARPKDKPFDPLNAAREEGPSIVQSFHESAVQRGGKLDAILADVCAFANMIGGVIYVGASLRKDGPKGLTRPKQVEDQLVKALEQRLTPALEVRFDLVQSESASILRLRVPKGEERPYCLDDNKFYLRDESDTYLAVRDEIIALIREVVLQTAAASPTPANKNRPANAPANKPNSLVTASPSSESKRNSNGRPRRGRKQSSGGAPQANPANEFTPNLLDANEEADNGLESENNGDDASADLGDRFASSNPEDVFYLPQIGVEIVETQERRGVRFHSVRDLRNGTVIHNVTRRGARHLWNYAIHQHEDNPVDPESVEWRDNIGVLRIEKRAGKLRYDLALREGEKIRVFYGVTDEGMEGAWSEFIQEE